MTSFWAAGLMTGTVLDGDIDVALIRTDGHGIAEIGPSHLEPYSADINQLLSQCVQAARIWNFSGPEPEIFSRAERVLTLAQAAAVRKLVTRAGIQLPEIGIVGFHGQTVLHRAPTEKKPGRTRQLGDGDLMARELGVRVAFDFRTSDMAAGGQGAPLCSIYHRVLMDRLGAGPELAILNLGGVANLSWRDEEGNLVGFDTGPASAPLDDFVRSRGLGKMDRDGRLARAGTVDEKRLARLLNHPYLDTPFPKSLDRFDFGSDMAKGLGDKDGAALLTAFAAACVGRGLDFLPQRPEKLVVCGGGRLNPALMEALEIRAEVEVLSAEEAGWDGDTTEAACFAFLGARVLRGLPISFPGTTGVPFPMKGGRIAAP